MPVSPTSRRAAGGVVSMRGGTTPHTACRDSTGLYALRYDYTPQYSTSHHERTNMEYRNYTATITMTGELVGGAPVSKGLAREYAELLIAGESNILKAVKKAEGEINQEAVQRYLEKGTSIFHRSKGNNGVVIGTPVLVNYQWTAMMRDA